MEVNFLENKKINHSVQAKDPLGYGTSTSIKVALYSVLLFRRSVDLDMTLSRSVIDISNVHDRPAVNKFETLSPRHATAMLEI